MRTITSRTTRTSAIAEAERLFSSRYPDAMFVERLALFLRHAYVITAPRFFVMFRPVRSDAKVEEIGNPAHEFVRPDAWYVDLMAGDMRGAAQLFPFPLPRICFYRKFRSKLHVYDREQFIRRISLCQ